MMMEYIYPVLIFSPVMIFVGWLGYQSLKSDRNRKPSS